MWVNFTNIMLGKRSKTQKKRPHDLISIKSQIDFPYYVVSGCTYRWQNGKEKQGNNYHRCQRNCGEEGSNTVRVVDPYIFA